MQNYGISGLPLDWFRNYLFNRVQYVHHNGATSSFKLSSCMWSSTRFCVIGPTLFWLYINDLPQSSTYFDFRLFADDSNILSFIPSESNQNKVIWNNRPFHCLQFKWISDAIVEWITIDKTVMVHTATEESWINLQIEAQLNTTKRTVILL